MSYSNKPKTQKYCSDYRDKKGCNQPIKWENYLPLVETGKTPWGAPRYNGHYVHMDGSEQCSSTGRQDSYQQTYAPKIDQEDHEQARAQSAGFVEAKTNSMMEQFIDKKTDAFLNRVEESVTKLIDNAQTKSTSNNVSIAVLGKDIGELRTEFRDIKEQMEAVLKVGSFQGADTIYKQNTAPGEAVESDL